MNNKIKVLIVEDEALIAHNLKLTLEDFDYEVVAVCYHYETALESIKTLHFDILLLDINLGNHQGYSGLDIASQLPAIKHIPFIFLTAFSDKDTIANAVEFRPSGYLVKPVNGPSIFAAIQTALTNFTESQKPQMPHEVQAELDYFFTKVGIKLIKIFWKDVYAIISIKNYIQLITTQNSSGYLIRSSLNQALKKIIPSQHRQKYIQINRNTAILHSIILEIKHNEIITKFGNFETQKMWIDCITNEKSHG